VTRDEILTRLRERIVAFAASRISRDVAEDIGQETLLVLEEKYAAVTELSELVPLALQIARYKLSGMHRTAHRRGEHTRVAVEEVQLPDPGLDPLTAFERKQMLDRLTAALEKTGDRCRQIMRWKLEGKSFAEIQELLGARSINTVYTWDSRCREHLLELLGGSWMGRP
jgi:RNA polymerase sigma-70 factor (ECF subfamily)